MSMELRRLVALEDRVEGSRLTPEEIAEWRQHPATQAFLLDLYRRKLEGMGEWAKRQYQREVAAETAEANARALGGMELMQSLIEYLEAPVATEGEEE